ncbi:MAG: ATP-binding protein [Candidatus Obscuribacterales bacterium]|nr:ATP-binding protein [Candidatus Obscuribacterales bacterium]
MQFFLPKKTCAILSQPDAAKVLSSLAAMFAESVNELNSSLVDDSLKIVVGNPAKTKELCARSGAPFARLIVHNSHRALSIRATFAGTLECFLVPTAQLPMIPGSEYNSRLRFVLSWAEASKEANWRLDGKSISEHELKLLILTNANDLLKYSLPQPPALEGSARLQIGNLSLTTGLRDLLMEKTMLLETAISQNEQTQSDIAREIHDSALAELQLMRREVFAKRSVNVDDVCDRLDAIIGELREICFNHSAQDVKQWGLKHALGEIAQSSAQRSGVPIEYRPCAEKLNIPAEVAQHVFRITQEGINNAIKHSGCSNISLSLTLDNDELTVVVEDDGEGFSNVTQAKPDRDSGGLGLLLQRERADLLTAKGYPAGLSVLSRDDKGTRMTLVVDLRLK